MNRTGELGCQNATRLCCVLVQTTSKSGRLVAAGEATNHLVLIYSFWRRATTLKPQDVLVELSKVKSMTGGKCRSRDSIAFRFNVIPSEYTGYRYSQDGFSA